MDECHTRKVRHGLADHHILHYLPQTQSHLFPKGQFDYAAQSLGSWHATPAEATAWQAQLREKKKNPPVQLRWMAKKRKKLHLKGYFLFLWGSDSCSSAHHHDGKVIDRPPTLRESNFTGNLQWLLGQSYTLIPEGKHHYGLSFISAVLGQFKPTQRTPFLGGRGGGRRGWNTGDDGWKNRNRLVDTKMWLQPIITFLSFFSSFFTRTRPTAAGPTLDGVQLSGMQIC